jgi:hypothetical protein
MAANILAKARAAVIRGLAVVAVVATYGVGSIGTQVAATVGFSTLALTASATPAGAWWRRGWGWRRPVAWGWRRPVIWGWRRPVLWGWRRPVAWGWGPAWGWRRGWGWRRW